MNRGVLPIEYRNRLAVGVLLTVLACGLLAADEFLAPAYPGFLLLVAGLGLLAGLELHRLLGHLTPPPRWLLVAGIEAVLLANWVPHFGLGFSSPGPWPIVTNTLTAVVLLAFAFEMFRYREPGASIVRLALFTWGVVYLGLLPSFLAQLRWWPPVEGLPFPDHRGVVSLLLAIFVPKGCDVGAFLAGHLLGRNRMTPILSPKKTWEGLVGGLGAGVLASVLLNRFIEPGTGAPLLGDDLHAAGFGLVVGAAAVVGDLAESLIKRDRGQKDASQMVPGFGGVLDVVDSLLFAAPVAYWWLRF